MCVKLWILMFSCIRFSVNKLLLKQYVFWTSHMLYKISQLFGSKKWDMTFEFASCYMLTVLPICVTGWTLDRFLWQPLSFVSRRERYDIPQADRYAKAGLLSGVSDTGRYWSCTTVKHIQIHSLAHSPLNAQPFLWFS